MTSYRHIFTKFLVSILVSLVAPLYASAGTLVTRQDSVAVSLRFDLRSVEVKRNSYDNDAALTRFRSEWERLSADTTVTISGVSAIGDASSEGAIHINRELAEGRARMTALYISTKFGIDYESIRQGSMSWLYDSGKVVADSTAVEAGTVSEQIDVLNRRCVVTIHYTRVEEAPEPEVVAVAAVAASEKAAKKNDRHKAKAQKVKKQGRTDPSPEGNPIRIKTNLLYDAVTVANLSLEFSFAGHWSFEFLTTYSPWDITPTFKLRTLLLQPEFRYYLKKGCTGHYFGIEGHCGWYNIAFPQSHTRYQDKDGNSPLWGAGVTYGYVLPFSRHWGMDFNIGIGYAKLNYDCFYNIENGAKYTTGSKDWIGPTKLGISIYYRF